MKILTTKPVLNTMESAGMEKREIIPWRCALLAGLSVFIFFLTLYCLHQGIQTVFTHIYYVPIILAAQTTGGSIGGMLAPARIIVGCSTAGLAGKEGQVLSRTIAFGLVITAVVGVVTLLAVW